MFEVKMYHGSYLIDSDTCEMGDLLPTIAGMLQKYEREKGKFLHQENYAIQWRKVKE